MCRGRGFSPSHGVNQLINSRSFSTADTGGTQGARPQGSRRTFLLLGFALGRLLLAAAAAAVGALGHGDAVQAAVLEVAVHVGLVLLALQRDTGGWYAAERDAGGTGVTGSYRRAFPLAAEASQLDFQRRHLLGLGVVLLLLRFRRRLRLLAGVGACRHRDTR